MIRAVVWRDKQGRISRFSVRGHANAAEYGQDIVCAAVSVLVTNAVNSAEHLLGVCVATDDQIEPGRVECSIPVLEGTNDDKLQLLFEAMVFGIRQVAEQYPDFVKLSDK
jgi:uncharacterized protein YsxB (DUF464 family)